VLKRKSDFALVQNFTAAFYHHNPPASVAFGLLAPNLANHLEKLVAPVFVNEILRGLFWIFVKKILQALFFAKGRQNIFFNQSSQS